jgi:hypothetical protein
MTITVEIYNGKNKYSKGEYDEKIIKNCFLSILAIICTGAAAGGIYDSVEKEYIDIIKKCDDPAELAGMESMH